MKNSTTNASDTWTLCRICAAEWSLPDSGHAITGVTPRARGDTVVRIWRSTARCYPKCYLPPALPVFSRGLLHSQTRRLQAIAGPWQGHEETERNHNPRVGGSSPSSATCAWCRIRPHHTAQVRNWQGLGRFLLRSVGGCGVATTRTLLQGFTSSALRFVMT